MRIDSKAAAGPYEICQRNARGLISREQVIEELSRWDYTSPVLPSLSPS